MTKKISGVKSEHLQVPYAQQVAVFSSLQTTYMRF